MRSNLLEPALAYMARGWSVIPVHGKKPAVPWANYQRELPSADQVNDWFACGNYNLAVVTGKISGLVVIDCDSQKDAAWWRANHPETPLVAISGGGGVHFYYRYPRVEIRCGTSILGRKIDVRAEGGLVVAPPSIHPETRQAYRWSAGDPVADDEIPMLDPAWLGPEYTVSLPDSPVKRRHRIHSGFAYIRHIQAESGNGGHNATFRAAHVLRESGLSVQEALDSLRNWNRTNAKPPWSERELVHKIEDAFKESSR